MCEELTILTALEEYQMDEHLIAEIWALFKEYADKKSIETAAERFVDLLADFGVDDTKIESLLGNDSILDIGINYYLDVDNDDDSAWD